jgi:secondary thiamine-phosphate synthase enzyme
MQQVFETISVTTHGMNAHDITANVAAILSESGLQDGLMTLLINHTSASLILQENADPDVQKDLTDALSRLAPAQQGLYRHSAEGADDMPAHIKSALTSVNISIPFQGGQMTLGVWQGIFLLEHRRRGHRRQVTCHLIGT